MNLLAHRLERFRPLNAEEIAILATLGKSVRDASSGQSLLETGDTTHCTVLIHAGWAMVHRELRDGRRQIIQFSLPGDLIDPCNILAEHRDFCVVAITPVRYSFISLERLATVIEAHPRLVLPLLWNEAREVYRLRSHLLSVGRLSARERLASVFLELWERLQTIGQTHNNHFCMHASQGMLADATGLSAVHVSRTLQRMEKDGLIDRSNGQHWHFNIEGLRALVPDMLINNPPQPATTS